MRAYQLHKHELSIALVLLFVLLTLRINKGVENWRKAEKNDAADQYQNVHTEEMLKKWVTTQYCKTDKAILCPAEEEEASSPSTSLCYTAFDPPVRFVLDLTVNDQDKTTGNNCSIRELIKQTHWSDKASAKDLEKDELITYFVAHLLDQIRSKSSELFRADDGSILEYEQSRLIESTLASILHFFTSSISQEGEITISTRATKYGIADKVWTRDKMLLIYHEAVLWHTQHKRHGHASEGAALRLSRQQPSFLFKFLPLVTEQIQNLELDNTLDSKYQKLYPFAKLGSSSTISLDSENPQSDLCLWSHYDERTLITEDCALALETAPLKMRDLNWEGDGNYSLLLVYIYNCFSCAFALWMLSLAWSNPKNSGYDASVAAQVEETEVLAVSNRSLKPRSNRSLKATSTRTLTPLAASAVEDVGERKSDQIRRVKWISLVFLGLTLLIALVSSCASETIQFSDFWDGMLSVMVAFLCLQPVSLGVLKQSKTVEVQDKRLLLLDPTQNKHYKKFASIEFEAC